MNDALTFDPESHVYTLGDKRLVSVTQILKEMGLIETRFLTEEGRDRGTQVHLATELYDRGTLDEDSLDPRLVPWLDGWKAFLRETGFVPILIEHRGASKYGYAGTLDRLGVTGRGKTVLLDIKSSLAKSPWIGIQIAFYQLLAEEAGHKIDERWSVHLPGDGTFRIEHWPDRKNDALAVWRAHKIKKECQR